MGYQEHKKTSMRVCCKVITVSDTRNKETDKSGQLINEFLAAHNHQVEEYVIVRDEKNEIENAIQLGLNNKKIEVILLTGGTGIATRDVTIEVVDGISEKTLPGFGELFRHFSYQYDIGSAAILSRATAGVAKNTAIFAMPGSSGAVKLAMERLVLPEMVHIISEIKK